ncbi:MAG: acyl carrier protein [Fimbriimonas sp.]
MTKAQFINEIEEILELDPGTLTGEEKLNELESWDSLAVLSFIAMADEKLGLTLSGSQIAKSETIDGLAALAGDKITG